MPDITLDTIRLARAQEAVRQEQVSFDQLKAQSDARFRLQSAIGWVAVVMIPAISVIASFIIFSYQQFSTATVTAATAALFVDVLGLVISVWKVFLSPAALPKLEPVTKIEDAFAREHRIFNDGPKVFTPDAPRQLPPLLPESAEVLKAKSAKATSTKGQQRRVEDKDELASGVPVPGPAPTKFQ